MRQKSHIDSCRNLPYPGAMKENKSKQHSSTEPDYVPDAARDHYTVDSLNAYIEDTPTYLKPLAAIEWLIGPQW